MFIRRYKISKRFFTKFLYLQIVNEAVAVLYRELMFVYVQEFLIRFIHGICAAIQFWLFVLQ